MNSTNEKLRGAVVDRLTGVLWAGVKRDSLDALVDLQDLLAALILLRPDAERLSVVIAWWHVRNRSWAEALRELRRAERAGSILPLGVALTAVCLYALEDPAWHTYACAAAWQTEEPCASQIARALLSGAGRDVGAGTVSGTSK